jgi:hypothetical protein
LELLEVKEKDTREVCSDTESISSNLSSKEDFD